MNTSTITDLTETERTVLETLRNSGCTLPEGSLRRHLAIAYPPDTIAAWAGLPETDVREALTRLEWPELVQSHGVRGEPVHFRITPKALDLIGLGEMAADTEGPGTPAVSLTSQAA